MTADLGAYHQLLTPAIPTLTGLMLSGCYKIPAIQMTCKGVFTNKMATDAYRGAGRLEATYLVERVMDLIAGELNMDPVELRRKNFPSRTSSRSPRRRGCFTTAAITKGALQGPRDRRLQKAARGAKAAQAQGRLMGVGVSTYVEICAMGPSIALPSKW